MKTFVYPKSVRIAYGLLSVLGLGVLFLGAVRGPFTLDTLVGFLLGLILTIVLNLALRETVRVDEERITFHELMSTVSLKWSEIDDVYSTPHSFILVSDKHKKHFVFGDGEYVPSLEQFDALQREVFDRTMPRLIQRWKELQLPIAYVYPGLLWSTMLPYILVFGLVLFCFILFIIVEGLLLEKFLFLVAGTLLMVPFFVRDYTRNRRMLTIENEGLRETNGRAMFIPWQDISGIEILEGPLSYSSILVKSNDGKRIKIPRSLMNCGQILYIIKSRTRITEDYGFAY
jgi:hypothetical protein